jgi:hypothetical protein
MNASEYTAVRESLGLTRGDWAELLDCPVRDVKRCEMGGGQAGYRVKKIVKLVQYLSTTFEPESLMRLGEVARTRMKREGSLAGLYVLLDAAYGD